MNRSSESSSRGPDYFSTTHWSLIVMAGDRQSPRARQALEALCRRYWFPLYAYVRRAGVGRHEAQDLTQEFFGRFLDKEYLSDVDRQRGRFRAFLLACLKNFLANQWDKGRAKKRGGGKPTFSLDFGDAEGRYLAEPADTWTADKLFHRRWAVELLASVLTRLESEASARGQSDFFKAVRDLLAGTDQRRYAEAAVALNMTEGALKTAIHRLRRRYRELLRQEIAQTVAGEEQVEEEIRELFAALRGE
jgi:DNA-directed RNA polymerase specialized sigma24 family protein